MITFGGRPLNTYKGGEMDWRTGTSDYREPPAAQSITKPSVAQTKDIPPAAQSITKPSVAQTESIPPAAQSKTVIKSTSKATEPIIVEVSSESVTIDKPGLFESNGFSENQSNESVESFTSENKLSFTPANKLSSKEIANQAEINRRASIETSWASIILGTTIGYIIHYVYSIIMLLFKLLLLLIIVIICVVLYKTIQKSLDASHLVLGGVGDTMQQAVDGAVIPGFSIMGITIPEIKLLGFLQGPTDEVKGVKSVIPEKAWQVILAMLESFWNSITNPNINIDFSMFD